jgi:flagellar basal body-associated protein FliL
MKKHEVHTLSKKAGFSSMKEELTKEVEHFLDKKINEGYEIVNISFTYYEAHELIAFITICK